MSASRASPRNRRPHRRCTTPRHQAARQRREATSRSSWTALERIAVDDPAAIVAEYRDATAPGSHLVLSHGTDDYRRASHAMTLRSRAEIATLLDGYELAEPGLVDVIQMNRAAACGSHRGFVASVAATRDQRADTGVRCGREEYQPALLWSRRW
jgi:hypothetical protein